MTTIYTDNAGDFATKPWDAADAERNRAVRHAMQLILQGRRGRAFYELTRSLQRQALYAGLGTQEIPACPCGGRCPSHAQA